MENVRIKDDALTKLKLPIQIKHGQIRKLDVSPSHTFLESFLLIIILVARSLAQNNILSGRNNSRGHRSPSYTSCERSMGST